MLIWEFDQIIDKLWEPCRQGFTTIQHHVGAHALFVVHALEPEVHCAILVERPCHNEGCDRVVGLHTS